MNLFINTSYSKIELYIYDQNYQKLYQKESINNHTIILYDLFNELLEEENITLDNIQKIYIVVGPGSFTGLRVGVVFAKTLAQAKNIPIYPVNLLEVIYATTNMSVAVDARGKKYFYYDGNEFDLIKEEEINEEIIQNNNINYNQIYKYLQTLEPKNLLNIEINYMKEVL